ncbi:MULTISPECIES: iron-containing alcohol dehydrogenase [unclassified Arenibacter]|uniref:iron-containing alcohol dehydrogenase n=1 Tax=unclassified Arenibacter TaxID=2615047 RepID=UPI000E34A93A|nr:MULTISPECIES: iron-containing alcohol dehydrogenase [unclassified Arenibacter]MCM4164624.1 alcohol dehydrogenase [Arenibacter sp. A80]RFT55705.1 iron-containing alcohol dehydrogenase [Arenibacter sp. P308M17]
MVNTFSTANRIISGAGASGHLLEEINRIGATRVLFITDPFMDKIGLIDKLSVGLKEAGITSETFSKVQPDPTVHNVEEGLKKLIESKSDLIVAVGGGSPIDAAKAISIAVNNELPLSLYMGYQKIRKSGIPVIAIPTTAGTGSEVTKVTVISDTKTDVKMMIFDDHLLPEVALIDYELTLTMPAGLTAHVGIDTLTHGIEAYVSKKSSAMTDGLALSCIRLVAENLENAWNDLKNKTAREAMAMAACHGGMAFTNSSVCLVHGMSRPLGVQFHLPHGLSNAVLLPTVTKFSISGAANKYAQISKEMGFAQNTDSDEAANHNLIKGLEALNRRLKVPRLRDCKGMDEVRFHEVLHKMADDALASGSPQNNPMVPSKDEIIKLYLEAW